MVVVKHVIASFFTVAVDLDAVEVKRDGEDQGQASAGVNVATYVLVVKGDVPPGTRSLTPTDTHFFFVVLLTFKSLLLRHQ